MQLREYVELLDNRTSNSHLAKKKLQYAYLPLDVNEVYLNFSAVLPEILDGKARLAIATGLGGAGFELLFWFQPAVAHLSRG